MNDITEKVRPIYERLKGYLAQFPTASQDCYPHNSYYWTSIDESITELNDITGKNYDKFKIKVIPGNQYDEPHIENGEYRSRVNGLIMNLKGEYFQDDNPFGQNPTVSVNQIQNVQVTMVLDVSTMIDKQLFGENAKNLKPEEKSFLQKMKDLLPTIKNAAELISLLIKTARESGLDIHMVARSFGLI